MKCENTYSKGISRFYDAIVNTCYYDYTRIALDLKKIFGERTDLLEIGIGTGLAAEKLIHLGYRVTGVDFSEEMLKVCRRRLKGKAELYCSDIKDFVATKKFDAAFSIGGAWYVTKDTEGNYKLLSYLHSKSDNIKALKNILRILKENGVVVASVQNNHIDLPALHIGNGHYYTHKVSVNQKDRLITKNYIVKKGNITVAEQNCVFKEYEVGEVNEVLRKHGFSIIQITDNGSFAFIRIEPPRLLANCEHSLLGNYSSFDISRLL